MSSNSKCRLCLATGITLVNVLEYQKLLSQINECLNILINEADKFPTTVCSDCVERIESWYSFRNLCFKSQAALKHSEKTIDVIGNGYKVEEVIKIEVDYGSTLINSDLIVKVENKSDLDIKLKENVEEIGLKNDHHCGICLCDFKNENEFLVHDCVNEIADNNLEKRFSCYYCTEEYESEKDLKQHEKTHTKVSCKLCGTEMLKTSLRAHMVAHTDRFKCQHCSHTFTNNPNLQQHLINVHSDMKNYMCDKCDKRFSSKANLNVHLKSHMETRDYKCNICAYSGRTSSALRTHMFIHQEQCLVNCVHCEKMFRGSRRMKDHIRRVHFFRKFECSHCQQTFVTDFKRKAHERVHTGERPYECELCYKSFKRLDGLKDHLGTHGLGNAIKCVDCCKNFAKRSVFLKHNCIGKVSDKTVVVVSDNGVTKDDL